MEANCFMACFYHFDDFKSVSNVLKLPNHRPKVKIHSFILDRHFITKAALVGAPCEDEK